jgi:hypothetical protein
MNPKINRVVKSANGRQALASGPIRWDLDETSATFSAVIAQMDANGSTVLAVGQSMRVFTPADPRWEVEVRTLNGEELQLGNADGWAVASVLENTGGRECYPWKVDDLQVTDPQPVAIVAPPHP